MHVAKYTRAAAAAMMHHYMRDRKGTLARDNIDRARTPQNYVVGIAPRAMNPSADDRARALGYSMQTGQPIETERVRMSDDDSRCVAGTERVRSRGYDAIADAIERIEGQEGARRVRKDAIVMADLVVTRPDNVPEEDERKFFAAAYGYMDKVVGAGNILGGWVHEDETTPHMHLAFMPVTKSAKGLDTFSFNRIFPRRVYRTLHKDMARYIGLALGYEPHLLLTDEEREKRIYTERTDDIDRIRDAARKSVADELDTLATTKAHVRAQEARSAALTDEITEKERERDEAEIDAQTAREDAIAAQSALSRVQQTLAQQRAALEQVTSDLNEKRRELRTLERETEEQRKTLALEKSKVANANADLIQAKQEVAAVAECMSVMVDALDYADSPTPDTYDDAVQQLHDAMDNPIVQEVVRDESIAARVTGLDYLRPDAASEYYRPITDSVRELMERIKQAVGSAVQAAIVAMRDVLRGSPAATQRQKPVQYGGTADKLDRARRGAGAVKKPGWGGIGHGHGSR